MKLPESLTLTPIYSAPSSWWQHVPIAHWIVEKLKPNKVVELGTHYGVSFFSFCEAAEKHSPNTFVYAIDTWEGDTHAGHYEDEVYDIVKKHSSKYHFQRSELIRSRFEEAATYFADNTIDILHIDGLHTYEAVDEDYRTWLPKLVYGGSIIFHDWNVRERGFGVWRLWEEIKEDQNFSCLETPNGHGLAIATLSEQRPSWHDQLEEILPILVTKGGLLSEINRSRERLDQLQKDHEEANNHSFNLEKLLIEKAHHVDSLIKNSKELQAQIDVLQAQTDELRNSSILKKLKRRVIWFLKKISYR